MANYDVLIIGGGVIGLSLARELHRLGQRRIAVVDSGKAGRAASYAAAGMLAPNAENEVIDDFYRFCDTSRQMFPKFAAELLDETGIDIELDRTGTIYAAFSDEDVEHLELRFARQLEAGIPVEKLSAAEVLKAEPQLSPEVRAGLFFPNDWQVENRKMLEALARYAARSRIEIMENTPVDALTVNGGRVEGAGTGEGSMTAACTVLATGAWTSLIKIGDAPAPIHVKPIRGQMISYLPPARMFRHVIYSPRGYLVPRADGRLLVGATVEDVGFDPGNTTEAAGLLSAAAAQFAPSLGELPIAETWAGLRPYAAGGQPIIGAVPGYDRLFVATGHYRNGILLTPITASMLAKRIVTGEGEEFPRPVPAEMSSAITNNANV